MKLLRSLIEFNQFLTKKRIMKFTSKKTGKSFILTSKSAADLLEDYYINQQDDVSQVKFFLGCVGMTLLAIGSILLHLQWNY